MLFDLRSSGRRNTVKIVYIMLAVLMGGGLVLFGIGGSVSGGLLDAISNNSGQGSTGIGTYKTRVAQAQRVAEAHPHNAGDWATLARANYNLASASQYFDSNAGTWNGAGKQILSRASTAWQHHLKVAGNKPDDGVAGLMVQAYSQGGLNQPQNAVAAEEVITEARPRSATFAQLAVLAYEAGQTRTGDLATNKAISLAPKSERATLKSQLAQAKQQAVSTAASQATPAPTASATATPAAKKKKHK
jgi:hypothetical protein